MDPVACDGVRIMVVDGPIGVGSTSVLAVGRGSYDGETFSVESDDAPAYVLDGPLAELVLRPLTGEWLWRYPGIAWYIER